MAAREGSYYDDSEKLIKKVRAVRHYGRCGEKGHNFRIYIVEIRDANDSDTFEE